MIIAGDCNLPDIDWENLSIAGHQYPSRVNKFVHDFVEKYSTKYAMPTRDTFWTQSVKISRTPQRKRELSSKARDRTLLVLHLWRTKMVSSRASTQPGQTL